MRHGPGKDEGGAIIRAMKTIVLGAGVVGATTALVLAERGIETVLIDAADQAGMGTSFANGSSLTPCHAEPWNAPGVWRQMPSALIRRDRPWCLRPAALPGLIGWGRAFLHHSSPRRYYRNARHCVRLGLYSSACLAGLRERHALEYRQLTEGSLELYFSAPELAHAIELRRRLQLPEVEYRQLDTDELLALEPALEPVAGRIFGSLLFPVHESGDARLFSAAAARRAGELGASVRYDTRVEAIETGRGRFTAVVTDRGRIAADACIVAAGCDTPALLAPLGLNTPIEPAKGYSATIELQPGDPAPRMPVLDLERRFVTARLGDRLRIAGLAEFAGFDRRIDPRRLNFLLESAATLLPAMRERIRSAEPNAWTGLRPMTPDGPPLLGPTPIPGLHLNSGHGSMGWTMAAGSAELVADLLTDQSPAIEPDGLLAARWLGAMGP